MKRMNLRLFRDKMTSTDKPTEPIEVLRGVETLGYYYPKGTLKFDPNVVIKVELRDGERE